MTAAFALSANHVGLTVSDLGRSIAFYRDLLGMKVSSQGTFEGKQYEAILGLQGASGKVAFLKNGNMQIELFEFYSPAPALGITNRPVCNHGLTHICIEVSDIDGEYERLKSAGVLFNSSPLKFFGFAKATYGRDPDGNVFELLEMLETDGADSPNKRS